MKKEEKKGDRGKKGLSSQNQEKAIDKKKEKIGWSAIAFEKGDMSVMQRKEIPGKRYQEKLNMEKKTQWKEKHHDSEAGRCHHYVGLARAF